MSQRKQRGFNNKYWQLALENQRETILHRYKKIKVKLETCTFEKINLTPTLPVSHFGFD